MGFLFQSGALFDSITIGENVAYPLRRHTKKSEQEIKQSVREKLGLVGLENDVHKMPDELSGGMRKRAAWREPWFWIRPSPGGRAQRGPRSDHVLGYR